MNGSMVTLQSVNLGTPGIEESNKVSVLDGGVNGGKEGVESGEKETNEERGKIDSDVTPGDLHSTAAEGRPGIERFVTAQTAALINSVGDDGEEREERPGVERFETAREDLNLLGGQEEKKEGTV